ncbi:DEAD/DEAH box helicase [Corynebacterium heidelbergense]|nr:DEAD/DEAH box helicase [Corynebacterium heidelbergense]WCZ36875.1 RNA polymerase-associated protein RapA [Corynebacterium heidelbergense]
MIAATKEENLGKLAPGVTVRVRDELWLVTNMARTPDGFRLRVRGVSDYVRDTTSTFFTALDEVTPNDPADMTAVADNSPSFRHSKLWLESTLRQTPVPLHQQEPEVATRMLADPLDYQLAAVRKALDPSRAQPRLLLADAVGLGKTLEIGMIAAELIRRGRGDRILVVTPKHVLEQFQQEMWTRFAIPLVRLDSQGIQRVRQKLPASKNPFTYFPRVIVSMDTLKSAKYQAQLEKVSWDIVVVDEIHNATNVGTQNNQLIRTLAPRTDALILASATPHNGNPDSFKEVLRLLDPLSVFPNGQIDAQAAQQLIIRRHRNSPEVASVVGSKWAVREEPRNILVSASTEEDAVAAELAETWLAAPSNGSHLFPWTLVKAFLSSPCALEKTIETRLKTLETTDAQRCIPDEEAALRRLQALNAAVGVEDSNKYAQLVNYLKDEVGIAKNSPHRAVVFSERVPTLDYLEENLPKHLELPDDAVKVMHGGMSDQEQMNLIDEFKRTDTPLRVLVTGDVASEGVNLHAQCHDLVHYDIPWSLIRIQQRNGRIDRYGQQHPPRIATLLLDPQVGIGETHVLTKLVDREHAAHELLGDAASLMGKHSVTGEEEQIREVLRGARDLDSTVRTPEEIIEAGREMVRQAAKQAGEQGVPEQDADAPDQAETGSAVAGLDMAELLALALGEAEPGTDATTAPAGATPQVAAQVSPALSAPSLYTEEKLYLVDALSEAFHDVPAESPARGGVGLQLHENNIAELTPPADLQRRFDLLPQDYVDYRHVKERLMLATSTIRGEAQLEAAREGDSQKSWPKAHFLGPLHPVTDWAADRALSSMSRDEIPAFLGDVDELTVLFMATLTSSRGQVITRAFLSATAVPTAFAALAEELDPSISPLADPIAWLKRIGLTQNAISPGNLHVPAEANDLIRSALPAVEAHMDWVRQEAATAAAERAESYGRRADLWEQNATRATSTLSRSRAVVRKQREILASNRPHRSLIRPLAVIIPRHAENPTT